MLRTVFATENPKFCWLDLVEPSRADLEEIVQRYGLYPTAVVDCLDPEHLPKVERYDGTSFVILRAIDEKAGPGAVAPGPDQKVAVFSARSSGLFIAGQEYQSFRPSGRWHSAQPALLNRCRIYDRHHEPGDRDRSRWRPRADGQVRGWNVRPRRSPDLRDVLAKRRVPRQAHVVEDAFTATRLRPGRSAARRYFRIFENAESMHFYADELLEM
jgi:Mg2+ and Co2+ transporter CorA